MNQKKHWENIYLKRSISQGKSDFVSEALKFIKPDSKILELGCGYGFDSLELSKTNRVTAVDFSKNAIQSAKAFSGKNLNFETVDISKPFKYGSEEFDAVYSRLSLHYFGDKTTVNIFQEIHRVLKNGGVLAFIAKSKADPLYGKGEMVEKDMFELNGHIRHFFSIEYVEKLTSGLFKIKSLKEKKEFLYDKNSAFIETICTKI